MPIFLASRRNLLRMQRSSSGLERTKLKFWSIPSFWASFVLVSCFCHEEGAEKNLNNGLPQASSVSIACRGKEKMACDGRNCWQSFAHRDKPCPLKIASSQPRLLFTT